MRQYAFTFNKIKEISGFKLIDAFESMVRYSIPLNVAIFEKEIGQLTQVIFVLQKI